MADILQRDEGCKGFLEIQFLKLVLKFNSEQASQTMNKYFDKRKHFSAYTGLNMYGAQRKGLAGPVCFWIRTKTTF